MKEGKDKCDVRISLCNAHDVDVVDTDPNEGGVTLSEDWLQSTLVQLENFSLEALCDAGGDISAIVSWDDDFAFLI